MTFSSDVDLGKAGRMRPSRDSEDQVPLPEQGKQQDNGTISSRETQPSTAARLWSFPLSDHHSNDAGSLTMHRTELHNESEGGKASELIK